MEALAEELIQTLASCAPDPARAATLAESLLDAVPPQVLAQLASTQRDELLAVLHGVCGTAPFLATHLRRHPAWLAELVASDLPRPRTKDAVAARVRAELAAAGDEPGSAEAALRRAKYFELARLSIRDSSAAWVPLPESGTTLAEISQLADVLLEEALALCARRLEARRGPPVWRAEDGREVRLEFCVLGLGKLGSEELNYSSDVDLVYVHALPPDGFDRGPDGLAPAQYFSELARAFGEVVAASSADGFLYRVDLELRPEGSLGAIVISEDALARYYETGADTWEKAAFMKARPVAGDAALGWRTIRALRPMIYRSSMDYGAVQGIRRLKEKIEDARGREDAGFDVKIGRGGIRDIEFVAQAMQLLHGGRIPQVRGRSTRRALADLAGVGLLPPEHTERLLGAYLYLRRVENRVQMEAERQRHVVPADPGARLRLARAMGHVREDALAVFDAELERTRTAVREIFESLLHEGGADSIMEVIGRAAPQLVAFPTTRRMLESLAKQMALEIDASADRERALNNLDRFVRGLGSRRFYYELLLDRPELVPRLVSTFAESHFLSDLLARHPRIIEPVFENPDTLLLEPEALEHDLHALRAELAGESADGEEDAESHLAALRLFHHRQVVNAGLLDLAGCVDANAIERNLSDIADLCVADALAFAETQLAARRAELPERVRQARFLVVGLGKLGSREMGYGSDLDLIFLYEIEGASEPESASAQDHFVRLAQRLISALQTATAEGSCYEIDARMRPSGNQGSLVTSLEAFRRYHDGAAQVWERQALLRARGVAGDPGLRSDFARVRGEILRLPLPRDAAAEIHRIRMRMESELARETVSRRDFKVGRGGLLDVESVLQYLRLVHGKAHPELLENTTTETQLAQVRSLGLLPGTEVEALAEGWRFLRELSRRLRIVENRSISDLDEERGDLDGLARRLGYESHGRESGPRRALLHDYARHTDAVRAVYERVFASAE